MFIDFENVSGNARKALNCVIQNFTMRPRSHISPSPPYFCDGICENLSFENILGENFCTENPM